MKVTIFQYRLFHYRVKLFELMRRKCAEHRIELVVVYGQPYRDEIKKRDTGKLDWAVPVHNRYFPIKEKKDLCWQPMPRAAQDSDLVIVMHENRLLANYWWLLKRRLGLGPRVAFWGHGRDFQSKAVGGFRERFKAASLAWADWWFAYSGLTEQLLLKAGYDRSRVTVLENAIDNQAFIDDLAVVDEDYLSILRVRLRLLPEHFVALYCGSLYEDKRLDILFDAATRVHATNPDFRLLIAGDGVLRTEVERFVEQHPWAYYLGVQHGVEKAALFRLAQVSLCPGAVGLNILDTFIAGTPLITRNGALHGPEIAFLRPDCNGFSVDGDAEAYADCLSNLIASPERLEAVRANALSSAEEYTVERMADRFVQGIFICLALLAESREAA